MLNGTWALDFMTDSLYGGRKFRTLNVMDEGNREALAIDVPISIPSVRVIRLMEELVEVYGKPASLRVDNGPELTAEAFVSCPEHRDPLHPTRKAGTERLHRALQLNLSGGGAGRLPVRIHEMQTLTDEWIDDYNTERPHDSVGRVPPVQFLPRLQPPREYSYQLST